MSPPARLMCKVMSLSTIKKLFCMQSELKCCHGQTTLYVLVSLNRFCGFFFFFNLQRLCLNIMPITIQYFFLATSTHPKELFTHRFEIIYKDIVNQETSILLEDLHQTFILMKVTTESFLLSHFSESAVFAVTCKSNDQQIRITGKYEEILFKPCEYID